VLSIASPVLSSTWPIRLTWRWVRLLPYPCGSDQKLTLFEPAALGRHIHLLRPFGIGSAFLGSATRFYWCVGPSYRSRDLTLKVTCCCASHRPDTFSLARGGDLKSHVQPVLGRLPTATISRCRYWALCAADVLDCRGLLAPAALHFPCSKP